jgi:hypothetical protein
LSFDPRHVGALENNNMDTKNTPDPWRGELSPYQDTPLDPRGALQRSQVDPDDDDDNPDEAA